MWARDYLRVLKREITFWEAKRCHRDNRFRHPCAGYSDCGWAVFEACASYVGGDSIVYLRLYWWDESCTLSMGEAIAKVMQIMVN